MRLPVLIRQHLESAPPGLLGAWLEARGHAHEVSRSWLDGPLPDPGGYAFVASLGHDLGANDTHVPAVAAERELLARAVAGGTPVLGLCYGGQVLAAALGGRVARAPVPELGWREIETDDPGLVPPGPWLEWHYDRLGPHLGVQFHPEATVEIVQGWARADGVDAMLAAAPAERRAAEAAAFRLFDAFADQIPNRLAA